MAKSYCKLDKKGMGLNFDGCVYPDSICSKCSYWIPEGKGINEKEENKDMIEALRTEYEKGRADVIADTLSWLENCWPRYCSNQTIIEGYKEAIKD